MSSSQPIFELIVVRENDTKQRYQCLARDDGPGYWLTIAEWCDGSWQTVRREPLATIELNVFVDLLPRLKSRESHHGISGRAWP